MRTREGTTIPLTQWDRVPRPRRALGSENQYEAVEGCATERLATGPNSSRADNGGTFRWYSDYQLPAHLGSRVLTVRLTALTTMRSASATGPRTCGRSRPEIRTSRQIFPLPVDAESINRGLEDSLYLRRAHSVSRACRHLNLVDWRSR